MTAMPAAFEELRDRGLAAMRREDFDEAEAHFRSALLAARSRQETSLASVHVASVAVFRDQAAAGVSDLPSIVLRRESDLHTCLAAHYYCIHLLESGNRETARRYADIALDAAHRLGDSYHVAATQDLKAAVAASFGAFEEARQLSLAAFRGISSPTDCEATLATRGAIAHNLGYAYLAESQYEQAISYLRQGIADLEAACGRVRAPLHLNLAFAYCALGAHAEAEASLATVRRSLKRKDQWAVPYVHYIAGEIAHRRGDDEEAQRQFGRLAECFPSFKSLASLLQAVSLLPLLLPEPR